MDVIQRYWGTGGGEGTAVAAGEETGVLEIGMPNSVDQDEEDDDAVEAEASVGGELDDWLEALG